MTRNEIVDFLTTHKAELRQTYGVQEIVLFGSYARQSAHEDSDIDIAVELNDEKKTLTNFFGLKRFLEERLGKRIDLGIKSAMKPIVRKAAQEDMLYV
ncbi:MAG: hypothetical protein CVU24_03705 [Betaproteobacteria bacterium HGW-Betaproteobacteria-18]|nr:MAG: hypothetical protein CVU24_03705 [Betaproteobacteria bacterium HGW-Betaproteobacteria-18]